MAFWASWALTAVGLAFLIRRRRTIQGTSLGAVWGWSVASLAAVAAVAATIEYFRPSDSAIWPGPLRFVAAVSTFCPGVALLGARRPQDGMWNFVVLSLWGVLTLPAAESLFLQQGQAMELDDVRGWFLGGLVVLGVVNLAPTRLWLHGVLLAVAQIVLLGEHLPLLRRSLPGGEPWALGLIAAAHAAALRTSSERSSPDPGLSGRSVPGLPAVEPWDRVWLDFRDLFGALWSLRVIERINTASTQNRWRLFLGWSGFVDDQGAAANAASFESFPGVRQNMINLMRRFVDASWIEQRLGESLDERPAETAAAVATADADKTPTGGSP